MGVIGVRVAIPGKFDDSGGDFLGSGIAWPAPAIAVGQGFLAAAAVGGQQAPELAATHAQQGYSLPGIDLAVQVAIKNLEPRVGKLLNQCHASQPGAGSDIFAEQLTTDGIAEQ